MRLLLQCAARHICLFPCRSHVQDGVVYVLRCSTLVPEAFRVSKPIKIVASILLQQSGPYMLISLC